MDMRLKVVGSVAGWASVAGVVFALGCGGKEPPAATPENPAGSALTPGNSSSAGSSGATKHAIAKIATTSDGGITGSVAFAQTNGQVDVSVQLDHAPPGQHAWHIHEGTSCGRESMADGGTGAPGSAAGPHWNPGKQAHGFPTAAQHHAGDFGNFNVDPSGKASSKISTTAFNLDGTGDQSAIGHALIIHGGIDDGQGTNGDAGARIGCGIIEKQ